MKKILEKVARFVELSKEFSVKESDVYEGFQLPMTYGFLTATSGSINFSNIPSPEYGTKQEEYAKLLNEKIEFVNRWEEYKILQADLNEYFNVVKKFQDGGECVTNVTNIINNNK